MHPARRVQCFIRCGHGGRVAALSRLKVGAPPARAVADKNRVQMHPALTTPVFLILLSAPGVLLSVLNILLRAPVILLRAPDVLLRPPDVLLRAPDVLLSAPDDSLRAPDVLLRAPGVLLRAFSPRTGVSATSAPDARAWLGEVSRWSTAGYDSVGGSPLFSVAWDEFGNGPLAVPSEHV